MKISKLCAIAFLSSMMILPAAAGQKEELQTALKAWELALEKGASALQELYASDPVVVTVYDPNLIMTHDQLVKYFASIKSRPNLDVTFDEEHIRMLGDRNAVIDGRYTITYDDNGKKVTQPSRRFTVVYEKDKSDHWKIVTQHVSQAQAPLK